MRPEPQLFVELTEGLPRQGPGSDECTRRALSMIPERASISRILDFGCGPGAQTLVLAQGTEAQLIALDLRSRFLNELRGRAVAAGVSERVSLVCGSMADAGFRDSSFDLIWSEGAIYIVGFERGLRDWSRLLKHGRCIVVSEATWLVANPPAEPAEFWKQHYPGMKSIDENLECAERAGYRPLGHFTVSSEDWWKNYYSHGEKRLSKLRLKYADDAKAMRTLNEVRREYDLFERYPDIYGYVFFVLRKEGSP